MSHFAPALVAIAAVLLAACGQAAPPAPTRSAIESRQTAVALEARPTLPPLPAGPSPTPPPDITQALRIADDDPRALGLPGAPILIVEYTDFE